MIRWLKNMYLLATEPINEKPKVSIRNVECCGDITVVNGESKKPKVKIGRIGKEGCTVIEIDGCEREAVQFLNPGPLHDVKISLCGTDYLRISIKEKETAPEEDLRIIDGLIRKYRNALKPNP